MLSSREVLPERYGPHSATTRCAPLPGLPPVMVSVLMSFMTTSSLSARIACAEKLRTFYGRTRTRRPERSLVGGNAFTPGRGSQCTAGEQSLHGVRGAEEHV